MNMPSALRPIALCLFSQDRRILVNGAQASMTRAGSLADEVLGKIPVRFLGQHANDNVDACMTQNLHTCP